MTKSDIRRKDVITEIYDTMVGIKKTVEERHPERLWMVEPPFLYLDMIQKAIESGQPYLWYFFALPQEMFRAFDVVKPGG